MSDYKISGKVIGKNINENGDIELFVEYTNIDGSKIHGTLRFDAARFNKEAVIVALKEHVNRMIIKVCNLRDNPGKLDNFDINEAYHESSTAELMVKPEIRSKDGEMLQAKEMKLFDLNEER